MAKNQIILEMDDSFQDNGLTRISPDTKFVIDHETGKVMYLFREKRSGEMIGLLLKRGYSKDKLRYNRYRDILIM